MKLYVDDERVIPDGWEGVRTATQAIRALDMFGEKITHISLDHDDGKDSFESVARFIRMMRDDVFMDWEPKITVHSANPVGRTNLLAILNEKRS